MAPLQKSALYGLVFGVVWAVAIIVVFITKGGVELSLKQFWGLFEKLLTF